MRAIRKFSLTLAATAILLLLAVGLTSVGANSRFTQSTPPSPSAKAAATKTMKTYATYSGLWRTDGSFVSTIRIKNILVVAPLDVTPLLFMADGTPYMLPPVHVPVSGVATVSVNDALAAAPQSVLSHASQFGSVSLIWGYTSPGHVSAQVATIDASRSLSFTYPFMAPMEMPGHDSKQALEGLWWKHDSGVTGFVALSNTTDQQQTATLTAAHPGNSAGSQQVSLAPHTTQMLTLEELDASAPGPDNHAGGIRVEYQGQQGAILVNGGLANESEGYSANIPFLFHDTSSGPSTTITFASAGLMLGEPDPMMMPGFPKDTVFSPYLALRNTTEKPLDVSLQVNYMMGMQRSMPVTTSLPTQHLAPFESRHTDLQGPLVAAGLKNFNGSINLSASFTGKAGDLVLATGSVDQTGTYVFEVEPQGVGSSRSKYSNYWGVAKGKDTMYSLWNPTDTPQDIAATFYYGDGSGKYILPVHLEPQASTMIDMAMLITEKKPDASGNLIPSSVQEGSAEFSSAKDRREMITPNPFSCIDGGSVTLGGSAEDCSGQYYSPDTNGWTTSDSSVATVDSVGNVTCKDAGTVNISASWSDMVTATGQLCGPPSCPTGSFGATSSGTVDTPTITQDKDLWFFGTGISTPAGFTLGATSATLTATGAGNGSYDWTITSGTAQVVFTDNNSSSITKTNVNTVGISSIFESTAANDVTIQLQFTPSGGSQMTISASLDVDSPYKLTSGGAPIDVGLRAGSTCSNKIGGTDGYASGIPYNMVSFFGQQITNIYVNETFGARHDATTNNWPSPTPGSFFSTDGTFGDCVSAVLPNSTPVSKSPQNPLLSQEIMDLTQTWYIGSSTSGDGIPVQFDNITYYQDHGRHLSVTSPIR